MKMHPSNHHAHGQDKAAAHQFAINATGSLISFQFPPAVAIELSGEKAKKMRDALNGSGPKAIKVSGQIFGPDQVKELMEFLNRCELRSDAEAAALGPAPPESDAGKGKRIDLGDGTHCYAATPEEEAALNARAHDNHHRIHAEFYKAQQLLAPKPEEDHGQPGE